VPPAGDENAYENVWRIGLHYGMAEKPHLNIAGHLSLVLLGTLAALGALLVGAQVWELTLDRELITFTGVLGFLLSSLATIGYGIYEDSQRFEVKDIGDTIQPSH
jgi:hypothetical protein